MCNLLRLCHSKKKKMSFYIKGELREKMGFVCYTLVESEYLKKPCQKISLTRLTQLLNFQPSHGKLLIVPKTVTLLGGFIIKPHHSLSKRGGSQYK